jgi:5-oxoprolinase (ATP-hydrolysing) subunit A
MGSDAGVMPYISSANIACGFHAGDANTMRATVWLALKYGVAIGAHPGYPDLQGFGRRDLQLSPAEIYNITLYQIGALRAIAEAEGGALHHVKPHGALYNAAAKDPAIAEAIAKAVRSADAGLMLYGLSNSALIEAGQKAGLRTCSEVFADRTYQPDGSLTPRSKPNALIDNADQALTQALELTLRQRVFTPDGTPVSVKSETICLHGDGPHAVAFARVIAEGLRKVGIGVKAP